MSTFARYFPLSSSGGGGGGGTVTSVGLSLPAIFTVTGSPVTTTGTLTGTLAVEPVNTVFAGPSSGPSVAPTFRALVSSDIPSLAYANQSLSNLTSLTSINQNLTIQAGITLNDSSNSPMIDMDGKIIMGGRIDWGGMVLNDAGHVLSVDWNGRALWSAEGVLHVDWENVELIDDAGIPSVNWGARSFTDENSNTVANYFSPTASPQFTVAQLGVQNSAPATTPGTVVNKIEVFDSSGTSLGFIAVYDTIT